MTRARHPLAARWHDGEATFGIWSCLPGTLPVEVFGRLGADYVCIDQQHGMHGPEDLLPLFQAVQLGGAAALTRVSSAEATVVTKALDAGADGVILPMVENAAQAATFVDVSSYPPAGVRSYGTTRTPYLFHDAAPVTLNQVCRIVMIETERGVNNASEIAATEGLDAVYIGPADLAISLGVKLGTQHGDARFIEAVETIKAACDANAVTLGMHCSGGALAADYARRGLKMLTVATDIGLLEGGTTAHLTAART